MTARDRPPDPATEPGDGGVGSGSGAAGSAPAAGRGVALIAAVPAAGIVLLALPWLSGRMRIGGDIETFLLPVRAFYSECLARGRLALWDPHLFCGFPLHAEGQTGVLHPAHLLLYRLLPVHWALQAEHLLVVALAFAGAHRLARALGSSRAGATFAGSAFAFSSFALAHYVHLPLVAVYAHTPWLCTAALRLGRAAGWRAGAREAAALAAWMTSQLLLGSPPAFVLSAMTWAVFLAAGLRAGANRPAAAGLAAVAVATAALAGAVQWMPTLAFLATTERGHAAADWSVSFSPHPWNLLQLAAPHAFRGLSVPDPVAGANRVELAIYPGLGLLLLATAAFAPGRRRPATGLPVRWIAAAAIVAALLMMGRYGGLAGLLTHVPVLSGFRSPVRHAAVVQFLLLVLALEGIRRVEAGPEARAWLRRACLTAGAVVAAAHAAAALGAVPHAAAGSTLAVSAVAGLLLCALGARAGAERPGAMALPAFLAAAALDLAAFGWAAGPAAVAQREIAGIEDDLALRPSAPTLTRVIAPWNREVLKGYRNAIGYAALEPRLPPRFDLAEYSVARIQDSRTGAWRDVPGALPRIRILSDEPSRLEVVRDDPREQEIVTACPGPCVLVVGDRLDPDWVATVDGQPVEVEPYLGALRAVRLAPGEHRVRLEYRPRSLRAGAVVSAVGLAGLLALAWAGVRGRGPRAS